MHITNEFEKDGVRSTVSVEISVEELKKFNLNPLDMIKAIQSYGYANGGAITAGKTYLAGESYYRETDFPLSGKDGQVGGSIPINKLCNCTVVKVNVKADELPEIAKGGDHAKQSLRRAIWR